MTHDAYMWGCFLFILPAFLLVDFLRFFDGFMTVLTNMCWVRGPMLSFSDDRTNATKKCRSYLQRRHDVTTACKAIVGNARPVTTS